MKTNPRALTASMSSEERASRCLTIRALRAALRKIEDRHRPRALLLDLDDTLLDHASAGRQALLRTMDTTGRAAHEDPGAALTLWRELEKQYFQQYLDGKISFEEQRVRRVREFLQAHGETGLDRSRLLDWFEGYRLAYEQSWRPFDDVKPFMDGVAGLVEAPTLGVVTNGDHTQQRKPDPAIFLHACTELGVAPGEAWFIGDNLEADAFGAAATGLRGVWLNRDGESDENATPPRAASLLDVLGWARRSSPSWHG